MTDRRCTQPGCNRRHLARGLCGTHYSYFRYHGMPTLAPAPLRERFESRVERQASCWIWTGATSDTGYGTIVDDSGTPRLAHRVSYEMHIGPIPDGLVIDHLCRVRNCVNPRHLEPVTHRENVLRGVAPAVVTHRTKRCKRNHEITPANSYVRPDGKGVLCRTCRDLRNAARYRRASIGDTPQVAALLAG